MRACIDCGLPFAGAGSRCPADEAERKRIRNADRPIAQATVADDPVCRCTDPACGHEGECGATDDLTADHVIPLALGGANSGPRRTFCRPCNSRKGARLRKKRSPNP